MPWSQIIGNFKWYKILTVGCQSFVTFKIDLQKKEQNFFSCQHAFEQEGPWKNCSSALWDSMKWVLVV